MKCINKACSYYNPEWLHDCANSGLDVLSGCPGYKPESIKNTLIYDGMNTQLGRPQTCPQCGQRNPSGYNLPQGCLFCGRDYAAENSEYCDMCKKSAVTPEPEPTGNGDVVLFDVLQDILSRAQVGKEKYGTYLRTDNGRDALVDAYEEAIDLAMYLKQKIMERDKCSDGRD